MSVNSVLTGAWRKPDTSLRCETLNVDGAIDCNTINAVDKLTTTSIENSGDITTTNILYDTTIINQVGSKPNPFGFNTSVRNTILRITDIDIAVGATEYYFFQLIGVLDLTNFYFSVNVLNSVNTQSQTYLNSISIMPYIATTADVGSRVLGLKNTSSIAMTGGTIEVLINWISPNNV